MIRKLNLILEITNYLMANWKSLVWTEMSYFDVEATFRSEMSFVLTDSEKALNLTCFYFLESKVIIMYLPNAKLVIKMSNH